MGDRMPARSVVDPAFDGHLERPLDRLTVEERLDWIWEAMTLLRAGRRQRADRGYPSSSGNSLSPETRCT
jgi:hypothetical protein